MKILVVHPAQQHSFHLATALKKKGWLYKYVTTVYYKNWSLTKFVSYLLNGTLKEKARSRNCEYLNSNDVIQFCELDGLIKLLAIHVKSLHPYYKKIKYFTIKKFSKKVVKYAIKNKVDAIICYDDCSSELFEKLKKEAPHILRIMDVSAANILYMRSIYEKDMWLQKNFAKRLYKEREIVWNNENIAKAKKEIRYTHKFLVPSNFVATSLKYSGVLDKQIYICPYGVNENTFSVKEYSSSNDFKNRPIKFIYVGGVKELKGISYLLEAIEKIPMKQAELTVVGKVDKSDEDIKKYLKRVNFTGPILHNKIPDLLKKSDVFIMPSLGEGLSLATLEAAACGLPLIVTDNSGVNDLITEGKEGFVIPIQSTVSLMNKMKWFIDNPQQIQPMGISARKMALNYTWDAYYQRMDKIFNNIMGDVYE